jgi:hypothetical protein
MVREDLKRATAFKIILTGMLLKNQNFYPEVEKVEKFDAWRFLMAVVSRLVIKTRFFA